MAINIEDLEGNIRKYIPAIAEHLQIKDITPTVLPPEKYRWVMEAGAVDHSVVKNVLIIGLLYELREVGMFVFSSHYPSSAVAASVTYIISIYESDIRFACPRNDPNALITYITRRIAKEIPHIKEALRVKEMQYACGVKE